MLEIEHGAYGIYYTVYRQVLGQHAVSSQGPGKEGEILLDISWRELRGKRTNKGDTEGCRENNRQGRRGI